MSYQTNQREAEAIKGGFDNPLTGEESVVPINEGEPAPSNIRAIKDEQERARDEESAVASEQVRRAVDSASAAQPDDTQSEVEKLMSKFEVTREMVKDIEDARPIYASLVFHQQYHIWVADPGGGKTTIANHVAEKLGEDGFTVWYLNLDAAAPDLKYYQRLAEEGNFKLLAPLSEGLSEEKLVEAIDHLAKLDADLSDYVLILDTLKKFTNVVSKTSKGFYKKIRALTRKGCTVIALAHANKYRSEEGLLIPEGTGDLKADCDNMSLLYKVAHSDHEVVSTVSEDHKGGKKRAPLEDMSFRMNRDRSVEVMGDYVDTKRANDLHRMENEYGDAIERAMLAIIDEPLSEGRFIKAFKDEDGSGPGARTARKLAIAFTGKHWRRDRHGANNAIQYTPIEE